MTAKERADAIIKDILVNHLPRVKEGFEKNYVEENQILLLFDHAVRARVLAELADSGPDPVVVTLTKDNAELRNDAAICRAEVTRLRTDLLAERAECERLRKLVSANDSGTGVDPLYGDRLADKAKGGV